MRRERRRPSRASSFSTATGSRQLQLHVCRRQSDRQRSSDTSVVSVTVNDDDLGSDSDTVERYREQHRAGHHQHGGAEQPCSARQLRERDDDLHRRRDSGHPHLHVLVGRRLAEHDCQRGRGRQRFLHGVPTRTRLPAFTRSTSPSQTTTRARRRRGTSSSSCTTRARASSPAAAGSSRRPAHTRPDPTLTGKANFGFVSKYKKGATVPGGSDGVPVPLRAASTSTATSYQWLVVAGAQGPVQGQRHDQRIRRLRLPSHGLRRLAG